MFRFVTMVMIVCMSAAEARAGETPEQLVDVLQDCGCRAPDMPPELLNRPVANSIFTTDDAGFMVAFTSSLYTSEPLELIVGDGTGWRYAEFPTEPQRPDDPNALIGPLWSIERKDGMILVGKRVAIDGIATSVLTPELERIATTYGSVLTILPNRLVVYERGQIHFAPTHYSELAVLDAASGKETGIYPPASPDPVRLARIARDRAIYEARGKDWCALNNHHCDPARFDNALWHDSDGKVAHAYDEATGTLAFSVVYGFSGDEQTDVLVVCTGMAALATIECRETALEESAESLGLAVDDRYALLRAAAARATR